MSRPSVSVVIPTHNRKEFLKEAIGSCFDHNREISKEVVVVDDGSTDGTREYLRRLNDERVRPFFQQHQGGQVARNRGLTEAQGEYIKFLDDDDWLAKGALQTEVEALEASGAQMSFGGYEYVDGDQQVIEHVSPPAASDIVCGLLSGSVRTHPLRVTCAHSLLNGLTWTTDIPCRQDLDFVLKVAAQDPSFTTVDQVVAYFRQHEGKRVSSSASMTTSPQRVHAEVLLSSVRDMAERGILDTPRRQAAAKGLWEWAHVVAPHDFSLFREMYEEIRNIYPSFTPRRNRRLLTILDSLFGPRTAEYLIYPARRLKLLLTSYAAVYVG